MQFNGSNIGEKIDLVRQRRRASASRATSPPSRWTPRASRRSNVRTLGGADQVTVNDLTGTDVTTVNVDLAASDGAADGSADNVIVNGTAAADHVHVGPVAGQTTVTGLVPTVAVPAAGTDPTDVVTVDGGLGDDEFTADAVQLTGVQFIGGDGADTTTRGGHRRRRHDRHRRGRGAVGAHVQPGAAGFVQSNTEKLVVNTLGGDDTITGQNGLATRTSLTIDGGAGDDQITGGDGDDLLIGGDGSDLITGGRGNDTALMGNDADAFVWNPGDGSRHRRGPGRHRQHALQRLQHRREDRPAPPTARGSASRGTSAASRWTRRAWRWSTSTPSAAPTRSPSTTSRAPA